MKTEDQYFKFVLWNEDDSLYIGYCLDLFPWGGVCYGDIEETTYHQLCVLVRKMSSNSAKVGRSCLLLARGP